MSVQVIELAEQIKEKGQRSAAELPALLQKAELLANDAHQDVLTRALAHRAAGNARQLLNQFQPALESYNAAAALLETIDEPVELGRTLHAKVGMLLNLSRFDELLECSARARKLFEQCSDRKRMARLDSNLASAYLRLGRMKDMLESAERALVVLEEIQDGEGFVAACINSAIPLMAMHEFERAEARYRKAMDMASRLNMTSWVLLCRHNLAQLRYLAGDTAFALSELEVIRKEYERGNDEWMVCKCRLDEAEILLEIGDLDESMASSRHARVLAKKLGLNSEIAQSLLFESVAAMRAGKTDAAALMDEATRRFSAEGDRVSTAVSKLQAAVFRGENGDATALLDASSARYELRNSGLPHRLALADIVIGRIQRALGDIDCSVDSFKSAMGLAESGRSEWMQFHAAYELGLSLDRKKDPTSIDLFKRADGMLDSLWGRLGSDDLKMTFLADRENVYTHLVRATIAGEPHSAFHYSEKARSRVLREHLLKDAAMSLDEIRARLGPDEAVVEYFATGNDLCIFVVRQDTLVSVRRPNVIGHLRDEWEDLERHIESCSIKWERLAAVREHLETTAKRHFQSLYNELIAPVESELPHNLIMAPHGFLHGIPLHALYDGKQYLAERFCIGYTPSASLYCTPAGDQNFESPLFVAFATSPNSSSAEEVIEASSYVDGATILINPSSNELGRAFSVPRTLVHMAGHAGIDPVSGKVSWIETTEGRLTSRDLTNMQIRAKTLVITGCQTARRIIQPGDEWLGLMRSFYLSGASTIVSALWDIRDEAARRFAREFYAGFDGTNASAAVQEATAAVRGWRTHPYFWAGFGSFVRKNV